MEDLIQAAGSKINYTIKLEFLSGSRKKNLEFLEDMTVPFVSSRTMSGLS